MSCFYTGQLPDVPMAPLFFRWFQAPPECEVQTTGDESRILLLSESCVRCKAWVLGTMFYGFRLDIPDSGHQ